MKHKTYSIYLSCVFLFAACSRDPKSILKMAFIKCQSVKCGNYEMSLIKGIDGTEHLFKCKFLKAKNDSVFSSHFYYKEYQDGKLNREVIYTGHEIVTIEPTDSTATVMSKTNWDSYFKAYSGMYSLYSPLTNNSSSPLLSEADLSEAKHMFYFKGSEYINNINCYHFHVIEIPEIDSSTPIQTLSLEYDFWISKSDSIPIQLSFTVVGIHNMDTIRQYNRYLLKSYDVNTNIDSSAFTLEAIPFGYKIVDFSLVKEFKPLPKGTAAPNWNLISLSNKKICLYDFRNKVVLLHFFYKGCYPCLLSLPSLKELHDKFYSKGLRIIGINPIDESKSELSEFIKKHDINYFILMDSANVARDYNVNGYPTLYIIDKQGNIVYTNLGYDKDLVNTVSKLVLEHL
ncbi:MAG: TlpA family protein disulfide reductase [Saprospiraceae bacterium]|nr:TlpA family protein disulfide reductase [Saprospiraceae bacterium]